MTSGTDEQLKAIFANVNDWLKFAEAKCALLVAADGAAAVGGLNFLVQNWKDLPTFWIPYFHSFIFFVTASAVVALFALIPRTARSIRRWKDAPEEADNFLFAENLAKYEPAEFLEKLKTRLGDNTVSSGLQTDYAQQIVIHARITSIKYEIFRISIWLSLTAVTTPLISVPLVFYFNSLHTHLLARLKK